jgi:hypothetical protein
LDRRAGSIALPSNAPSAEDDRRGCRRPVAPRRYLGATGI